GGTDERNRDCDGETDQDVWGVNGRGCHRPESPGGLFLRVSWAERCGEIHDDQDADGLLAPTSGRMELLGLDFQKHPVEVKRQIGVVPEGMGLFERLTGVEYLRFVGRMYGL